MSEAPNDLPHDEPRQIVVTGEAGSGKWNPAYGTWAADDFGMSSEEPVGDGERLFVNRKLYDTLQAKVARLEAAFGEAVTALEHVLAGKPVRNADEIIARQALKETTDD